MQVNEKNISGKIIVATQEAFNAFKETAENLKQAFEADFHNTKIDIDSLVENGTEIK